MVGLEQEAEGGELVRGGVDGFLVLNPVKEVQHPVELKQGKPGQLVGLLSYQQLHIGPEIAY